MITEYPKGTPVRVIPLPRPKSAVVGMPHVIRLRGCVSQLLVRVTKVRRDRLIVRVDRSRDWFGLRFEDIESVGLCTPAPLH